jgi:ferric-dicitrate binding protein FerR (iron transport regulator)
LRRFARALRNPPMPARTRTPFGALALAALVAGTVALAQPPAPDPLKKLDPPTKAPAKDAKSQAVKLPDGTFLWLGTGPDGERITLSPQEYQKLVDRADALKKELAARKPNAPRVPS